MNGRFTAVLAGFLGLMVGGCNLLGPAGAVIGRAIPQTVQASYKGLAHQPVVVIVWADRGIRIDNPNLQLDLTSGFEQKLKTVQKEDEPKELEGVTFPVHADTVVRDQEEHPEQEFQPITETALKFSRDAKATRLIYIEISDFSLHPEASQVTNLGSITGSIKVFEMSQGKVKEAFKESDVHITFPKDSPPEGLPLSTDYKIYQGTLDLFTTELAKRLYAHEADEN